MLALLRLLIIFSLICSGGCSWFGPHESSDLSSQPVELYLPNSSKIIDKDLLKKGGKIAIIPFVAGPGVEADDQLDKISLMLVKGIAEELQASGPFEIVTGDAANEADFILEGRVTSVAQTAKWEKWATVTLQNNVVLGVKGRITDVKSKEVLAVFSNDRTSRRARQNHQELGLMLGHDIGKFILTGIQ